MNVNIQTVKFDADKRLVEFVEHKLAKMDRFAERSTGADVVLKLDKDFDKGNKVATITLHMPGSDLVSEQRAKTFEEAIDLAIDALKRQNEKLKAQYKKKLPAGAAFFCANRYNLFHIKVHKHRSMVRRIVKT